MNFRDIQRRTRNYLSRSTGVYNWWSSMFASATYSPLAVRPDPVGFDFSDDVHDALASAYAQRWQIRTATGGWNRETPWPNGFGVLIEIAGASIYAPDEFPSLDNPTPCGEVVQAAVNRVRNADGWKPTIEAAEGCVGAAMHFAAQIVNRLTALAKLAYQLDANAPLAPRLIEAIEAGEIDPTVHEALQQARSVGDNSNASGIVDHSCYLPGSGTANSGIGVKASVALEEMAQRLMKPKLIALIGKLAASIQPGQERVKDIGPYFTNIRRSDELDLIFEDERNRLGDADEGIAAMATLEYLESGLHADDQEATAEECGDFVILMDRSYSMTDEMQDGLTRHDVAAALVAAAHAEATARGRNARVVVYDCEAIEVALPGDPLGNLGVLKECYAPDGGTNSKNAFWCAQDGRTDMSDFMVVTDGADQMEWTREVIGRGGKVSVLVIDARDEARLRRDAGLHEGCAVTLVPEDLSSDAAADAFFAAI